MDLIKEREKRTIRRKIAKSKFDNMITLSAQDDIGIRLLDEGTVVTAEGNIWFYIEKGALERFLETLDEDFVGYINYGHTDFATDPILLGQYSKSDLNLVDIGDGRNSLYVKPHFFDTYRLKDIQAMPFDVGVSVEMNCWLDEEATEDYGFDVVRDLFISGFAVVGDAGNVNSSGIRLNGGSKLDLKEITKALEAQSEIDLAALKDALGAEETEETVEETVEVAEEPTEEIEASVEEEETEETSMDDVLARVTELTTRVETLETENTDLRSQIETLTAEKNEVSEKLSAKEGEISDFLKAFSGLKLNVSDPEETHEVKKMSIAMDGIGE